MEAPQVQIDTSLGSFVVELYYKHAPRTVENFVGLARKGYYDGVTVRASGLLREVPRRPYDDPCARQAPSLVTH